MNNTQVSISMAPGLGKEELHSLHLERFDNLCTLARIIPVHVLHISLRGAFWQEIDQTLEVTSQRYARHDQQE